VTGFTVSLTFDNGPHPEVTPIVLDLLAARGIKATFFIVGRNAEPATHLLDRAHDEGHWIGNHTWTHSVPFGHRTEPGVFEAEIQATEHLIGHRAHPRKYFRPFGSGGLLDRRLFRSDVVDALAAQRYTCVLWNNVPRDWDDPSGWPETALDICGRQRENLVVLHDVPNRGAMRQLGRFLDAVGDRGGRFVQDFPDETLVMDSGVMRPVLADYVTPYGPEERV